MNRILSFANNIWPYVSNLKCKQNIQIKYDNNGEPNSLSCFCRFVFSIKPSLLSFAHCGESICLLVMPSGFKSQSPDAIFGLSLLMVLYLAPRNFSPGTPVLPSPQNSYFLLHVTLISIWNTRTHSNELLRIKSYLLRG